MSDSPPNLLAAIGSVAPGRWAVGVSGGADSVALLALLLRRRPDLHLHVAHLDHETRDGASGEDARFVADLAARWGVPATVVRLGEIALPHPPPRNRAEQFRAARFHLFRQVIRSHGLDGMLLAHHSGDQAETVLQRLLRGAGAAGLTGIAPRAAVNGVVVVRPLLEVTKETLRAWLAGHGIAWREDATNALPLGQRNRVRRLLRSRPRLSPPLVELAGACDALTTWLRDASPTLPATFDVGVLRDLPRPLAREAAGRWLRDRAAAAAAQRDASPADGDRASDDRARSLAAVDIPPAAVGRLLEMVDDAASPPRQHFPGRVLVRRRGRTIGAEASPSPQPRRASGRSSDINVQCPPPATP